MVNKSWTCPVTLGRQAPPPASWSECPTLAALQHLSLWNWFKQRVDHDKRYAPKVEWPSWQVHRLYPPPLLYPTLHTKPMFSTITSTPAQSQCPVSNCLAPLGPPGKKHLWNYHITPVPFKLGTSKFSFLIKEGRLVCPVPECFVTTNGEIKQPNISVRCIISLKKSSSSRDLHVSMEIKNEYCVPWCPAFCNIVSGEDVRAPVSTTIPAIENKSSQSFLLITPCLSYPQCYNPAS